MVVSVSANLVELTVISVPCYDVHVSLLAVEEFTNYHVSPKEKRVDQRKKVMSMLGYLAM